MTVIALLLALQDVQDGVYTHQDYAIRFTARKADIRVRSADFQFRWPGSLCEIEGPDDIGGVLVLYTSAMKVDKYAAWREASWTKLSGVRLYRKIASERLDRKTGDWLREEHTLEYAAKETVEWHYVETFISHGKRNLELTVWCPETRWEENRDAMRAIADSLRYADAEHPWAKLGEGSWVEFRSGKTTARRTLVKKTADRLTFRADAQEFDEPVLLLAEPEPKKTGEGEEELEIAGKKLKCRWIETATYKIWTSDEVPGGTVRKVTPESETICTGFEKR